MMSKLISRIKNNIDNNRGVTIVELLIYMGLFSFLLIILTEMFVSILNLKAESEATSYTEQDGRYVMARLINDINNANSISSPSLGNTLSSMSIVIDGETYSYSISGDYLQLTNNSGTYNLNSSETSIENISFRRVGNSIKIQFDVVSKYEQSTGFETKTFKTTTGIR